ncbi:acyl-CoA dehydrogenase [Deinococcus radiophilus]|nr:acyl-CoA dehydrogenase [Deinococcus radiophilus]
MNFALDDEGRLILQHVRDFCRSKIAPLAHEYDREHRWPAEQLRGLAELGLMGATVPEQWGGAGLDSVTYALCLSEVAAADPSVAVIVSVQNGLPEQMILNYGTDEQRGNYLQRLASGEWLGAFCLTEAHAGSDAANLKARAERSGDGWVLNGSKAWITSGGHADVYLVMARTGGEGASGVSCFIVEKDTPGLSFGQPEAKMGQHAAHTTTVTFDNVSVGEDALVGAEGQGLHIALASLDSGRIGIGMLGVGIAQAALEHAAQYAAEREQFGKPIAQHQAVAFKLARMATQLEAARLVGLKAAWLKDQGQNYSKEASMAKLLGSEAAVEVTRDAVQIFGGNGYSAEYPVEKLYRDAKITEIYEGTSEIQQLVISRAVLRELT